MKKGPFLAYFGPKCKKTSKISKFLLFWPQNRDKGEMIQANKGETKRPKKGGLLWPQIPAR